MTIIAATSPSPLWYLTRGTGLICLVLLTVSVALGIVTKSRWQRQGWPRFVSEGLHRNISLLVVVLLAIHIVTAELDTFAPVGWLAEVVPFASAYRPIWLGLGTLGFDLVLALTATSLMRARLGLRAWRVVHWLAYLAWPAALLHGLGTGTDAKLGWVQILDIACAGVVLITVCWRLAKVSTPTGKLAGALAVAAAAVAVAVWSLTGPLRPGWAKRAGTPSRLLASTQAAPSTEARAAAPSAPPSGMPAVPFDASLQGSITQSGPDSSGAVTITIHTRVSGAMTGSLALTLRGQAAGGGVSLASSSVSFGPAGDPADFQGQVVLLSGDQLVANVEDGTGTRIVLGVLLQIDPSSGSVRGSLHAGPAYLSPAPAAGGDDDSDGGR